METLLSLAFLVMMAVPVAFLFMVTGRLGPLNLPDSFGKHCEACEATWAVLYRNRCPKCRVRLSESNMFTSAEAWRAGLEAAKSDAVMAEALEMARARRRGVQGKE